VVGGDRARRRLDGRREDELVHRRDEQEEDEEDDRGAGQHGAQRAHRLDAGVGGGGQPGEDHGAGPEGSGARGPEVLEHLQGQRRDQQRDEGHEHRAPCALTEPAGQPHHEAEHERREEHEPHREGDDVAPGLAAGGEELGIAAQQVEQRLGHGQRPQRRQVARGDEAARPRPARGRAPAARGAGVRAHGV
jgi:hypothetical protein